MRSLFGLFIITGALATPALASDVPGKTSIALRAGTLGMGVELAHTLPVVNLTARIAWNGYGYETDDTIDDIDYDLSLDLGSVLAMIDWRPWGSVTHFTAGVVFNGNEIGAASRADASYTIGGMTYAAADVGNLTGKATFDSVVPYAGLGWRMPVAPKTSLNLELGVVFQGSPALTLVADGPIASDPLFQAELDSEVAQFQEDIEDYKYYPVVVLGIARRF